MKLLHIITDLGQGGAEAILYRLVYATHDSIEHSVVSLHGEGFYAPKLRELGVKVEVLNMPKGRLTVNGLKKLKRYLKENKPDLIQTRMVHADLVGGVVARMVGSTPVVWAVHATELGDFKKTWKTRFIRRICALLSHWIPSAIITDAQGAKQLHISLGYSRNKFTVIPNGVDLSKFRQNDEEREKLRSEWNVPSELVLLGFVARWDPLKDHRNLLKALSILNKQQCQFQCVLVGNGMDSNNSDLRSMIEKYELNDKVLLAGPRSDVINVMNALDVHVLSSCSESLPVVLIEAMACATPCVATNVGDVNFVIGEEGWVVPPADSEALAKALHKAISEANDVTEWRKRKVRCRNRIVEKFSSEFMIDAYKEVWEKAFRK